MKRKLCLILLMCLPISSFGSCKITKKLDSFYVDCEGSKGYVKKDEGIDSIQITYQDENGGIKNSIIQGRLTPESLDLNNLTILLKQNGINQFSKLSLKGVNLIYRMFIIVSREKIWPMLGLGKNKSRRLPRHRL